MLRRRGSPENAGRLVVEMECEIRGPCGGTVKCPSGLCGSPNRWRSRMHGATAFAEETLGRLTKWSSAASEASPLQRRVRPFPGLG